MKKVHLFSIDNQNCFCDPKGSLFVKGADNDMQRLAIMIDKIGDKLDDMTFTIDSHHIFSIFHPIFWKDNKGNHPQPFTAICKNDVENGTWTVTRPGLHKLALNYVSQLEKNNRYPLIVWPVHAIIGTWGQGLYQPIVDSIDKWCNKNNSLVNYICKGSNPFTEHYSAIVADVPDPSDPTTQMNVGFLNTLNEADIILLAGEAGSHCLANTGRDAINYFTDDSFVKKLVLLEDATSPVPGFEGLQEQFIKDMTARGMQLATTKSPL